MTKPKKKTARYAHFKRIFHEIHHQNGDLHFKNPPPAVRYGLDPEPLRGGAFLSAQPLLLAAAHRLAPLERGDGRKHALQNAVAAWG